MSKLLTPFLVSLLGLLTNALPTASNCTTGVHMIVARGTGELPGTGSSGIIASAIAAAIPGSDIVAVDYPATFDFATSLAAGVKDLQSKATSYAQQCPGSKMVLMGYSQGAQVMGDSVAGGGAPLPFGGLSPAAVALPASVGDKIVAVIQFGDPNRLNSQGTNADVAKCTGDSRTPRTGANREKFQTYQERTQEWCNEGDPICCGTGSNFLAHLSYFTPDTGSKAAAFVKARL